MHTESPRGKRSGDAKIFRTRKGINRRIVEEISEMKFTNPLFKSDPSYMEKVNRNMIKKMNKEIKKPTS